MALKLKGDYWPAVMSVSGTLQLESLTSHSVTGHFLVFLLTKYVDVATLEVYGFED